MNKTIMIVDDFKTNTVVIKHALHSKGFDILEANDGEEALKYFDGRQIDLMVTDFKMPGMTGAELTKAVKSKVEYTNMPVLILSSEKSDQCKTDAREAGAYGWLNKPFDLERFLKIINSIFK
jgi:two-component system chemotaxis response regulator CheY